MTTPLVSVVIPMFNAERTITETLKSVQQQTMRDWELIVVDDGSTDLGPNMVEDFSRSCANPVRLIKTRNMGGASARNTGIGAAHGELIALLDSDDLWHPSKLTLQIAAMRVNPTAIGCGAGYEFLERGRKRSAGRVFSWNHSAVLAWLVLETYGPALNSTFIVKRSELEALGGFDSSLLFAEDLDLGYRLVNTGKIVTIDQPVVYYRISAGQINQNVDLMKQTMPILHHRYLWSNEVLHQRARANLSYMLALRALRAGQLNLAFQNVKQTVRERPSQLIRMSAFVSIRRLRRASRLDR